MLPEILLQSLFVKQITYGLLKLRIVLFVDCELWRLTNNVSAANGIFYPLSSVANCMDLCLSMSDCVAIDIWPDVCSIHINTDDLLSNRLTSGVSQYVLNQSCKVSTVTASILPPVVTTQIPTLRTTTRTTYTTTDYTSIIPGINFVLNTVVN